MGNLSSKKTPKITARDRAILDLKVQRDRLKQYQKKIAVVLERETQIAKEQVALGNRERALLALKMKKYQEKLLEKTGSQLLSLEQLTSTIEFSLVEQQVFAGLKQGNAILADIQKELSIEAVEKIMADASEFISYQQEISDKLAGTLTVDEEGALEEELEAYRLNLLERELPDVASTAVPGLGSQHTGEAADDKGKEKMRIAVPS